MTVWDWLLTPQGQSIAHAVEVLFLALTAFLSAWTTRVTRQNQKMLNSHLADHTRRTAQERLELERRIANDR